MAYLITIERPGGVEIERQTFSDLATARSECEARTLAWANKDGATIGKVHHGDGNVDTWVKG